MHATDPAQTPATVTARNAPNKDLLAYRVLAGVCTMEQAKDEAWGQAAACITLSNECEDMGLPGASEHWSEQASAWVAIADTLA